MIYTLPRNTLGTDELLSAAHASKKESNSKYLLKVSHSVRRMRKANDG